MSSSELQAAAQALEDGLVVGLPTDTVYGLAVDPRKEGATARLFAAKGRPEHVALPVLIAEPALLGTLAEVSPAALRLAMSFWPGPLTLVLPRLTGVVMDLGGDPSTVGVRCPANALARELLARSGPLAVTSANRHGEAPLTRAEDVRATFEDAVATVVDGGTCDGAPSAVVLLVGGIPVCLRPGAIAVEEILQVARIGGQAASRGDWVETPEA